MSGLWIDELILKMKRKPAEKLLLALICFRASGRDGHCYDSNKELANVVGIHFQNVSEMVQKFKEEGLINVVISRTDSNARTIDPISYLLIPYTSKTDRPISHSRKGSTSNTDTPISNSRIAYKSFTDSHYKEEKPLETKEEKKETLNKENTESEILEIEAEEVVTVFPDEEKKDPNPVARPPSPADLSDEDRARLETFTEIVRDPKVLFALSSTLQLKGEVALMWIDSFATEQWASGDDLKKKSDAEWRLHCQRWIADKLAKQKANEQRPQRPGQSRNRSGESRAETGSEIDELARQYGYS